MKVGNVDIPLYYSTFAAQQLNDLCGGIKNIKSLISTEGDDGYINTLNGVAKLATILANGEVGRYNRALALGIESGEKKDKYTEEDFIELLDAGKLTVYIREIFEVMGLASKFIVPEGVNLKEPDIDLDEIEEIKNPSGTQS